MSTPVSIATRGAMEKRVPPLQAGDRLTREEFKRRYEAMPHLKKAELIEGVVYMPSPVRTDEHAAPQFDLIGWLAFYRAHTPGTQGGDNGTIWLDLDNGPQPDAFLRIRPDFGGQSKTDEEGYVVDAPELVAEVAASTASYDLHDKLKVYRRNGVLEYLVWLVEDREIHWYVLRESRYERMTPAENGLLKSMVFPGLWLDPAALIRGDMIQVLKVAQQGVDSREHADFVKQVEARKERLP